MPPMQYSLPAQMHPWGVSVHVIPYLVGVSLQAQGFLPSAQVPDPHRHVIGGGNQEVRGQGVEADGVNLLCVTW